MINYHIYVRILILCWVVLCSTTHSILDHFEIYTDSKIYIPQQKHRWRRRIDNTTCKKDSIIQLQSPDMHKFPYSFNYKWDHLTIIKLTMLTMISKMNLKNKILQKEKKYIHILYLLIDHVSNSIQFRCHGFSIIKYI
jgi:hypothetical protein